MKIEWKSCFRVGVCVLILALLIRYWSNLVGLLSALAGAAMPLILGCAIAYLVNILMAFYERHYFPARDSSFYRKSRRPLCLLAAFLTLAAAALLIIRLVWPQLVSCLKLIVAELPDVLRSLAALLQKYGITDALENVDWQSVIRKVLDFLASGLSGAMRSVAGVVSSVFSGIVTAFLALIFSIYLLAGKERLQRQCNRLMRRYLRPRWYDRTIYVLSVLHDCFRRYIIGQCTEAVILGVLCALGMLILRLPYAAMIGALIGFTALIPVAGAYIGGAVGALMILSVSPSKALVFLIYLIILQQLEGNLIYPRVVGTSLGLPAIWVLAAVTIGGGLLGVVGMLLGVPLAAALYRLLKNDLNRVPEAAEGIPSEKEEPCVPSQT